MSFNSLFLIQITCLLLLTLYQLWSLSQALDLSPQRPMYDAPHEKNCIGQSKTTSQPVRTWVGRQQEISVDKNSFGGCLIIQGKLFCLNRFFVTLDAFLILGFVADR